MLVSRVFHWKFPRVNDRASTDLWCHQTLSWGLGSRSCSVARSGFSVGTQRIRFGGNPAILISCDSYRRTSGRRFSSGDQPDHDYVEASLLLSETILHFNLMKRGFQQELKLKPTVQSPLSFPHLNDPGTKITSMEQSFLHRFKSPTMFLRISCGEDFILPIAVGEYALEKLKEAQGEHKNGVPEQFQFIRNLVERLDHEVIMVRITERVVNTYCAILYLNKKGKDEILTVDSRPSDAINVAIRCKAPIYVSKEIVFTDAIRIGYGMGRMRSRRVAYDVSLDSPVDGPDLLAEELDMIRNMHVAIDEERFRDAAVWKDKLANLRKSESDH